MPVLSAKTGLALVIAIGSVCLGTAAAAQESSRWIGMVLPGFTAEGAVVADQPRTGPHLERRRGIRRNCSPEQAVDQARGQGLRQAEITGMGRRRIVVEGRGLYGWGRMVFANMPGCPLIAR
ncbi:hypothetical protein LJR030_002786 [Rhizobium sp. LjRoot30]|uniref:hypothetical protein n=1 Tax=Rhizobium sp. LjRoot30 TaxID=3342320 RepID=UPI003ECE0985